MGSGLSVEYLSVDIAVVADGCHLRQWVYTCDLLPKLSMDERRPDGSLDNVGGGTVAENEEPMIDDVRAAQRLAGGRNSLATRTRPGLSLYVSQLASAATKQPKRAIALGKRTLRYLAGTRDHGIMLAPNASKRSDCLHAQGRGTGTPPLEGFGDASYEEGWGQTGVVVKYLGMLVAWKSTKQPQVPRSTAESECTAMAYAAQFLEGVQCLFIDMRVETGIPALYCDNRAAVHLSSGSSEWRTKALVNRILGVKSLIELGQLIVLFKPTLDMEADLLTKFMGNKLLSKQRKLLGCIPPCP